MRDEPYLVPVGLYAKLNNMDKQQVINLIECDEIDGEELNGKWYAHDDFPEVRTALTNISIPFTSVFVTCLKFSIAYFLIVLAVELVRASPLLDWLGVSIGG